MATLDDKILGEKLQNYCSSSSSEEEGTYKCGSICIDHKQITYILLKNQR
jgi:hypothetical protein